MFDCECSDHHSFCIQTTTGYNAREVREFNQWHTCIIWLHSCCLAGTVDLQAWHSIDQWPGTTCSNLQLEFNWTSEKLGEPVIVSSTLPCGSLYNDNVNLDIYYAEWPAMYAISSTSCLRGTTSHTGAIYVGHCERRREIWPILHLSDLLPKRWEWRGCGNTADPGSTATQVHKTSESATG